MQLTIPRSELKQALTGLSRVVPKRATLPVLQKVRVEVKHDRTTVTGTDLDQVLTYRSKDAKANEAGSFLIGIEHLQALSKGPDGDAIEIRVLGDERLEVLDVVAGQSIGRTLATEAVKEWPNLGPAVDVGPVDPAFLVNFRRASVASSIDESRRILNGVLLETSKQGDHLVATDGRRLTMLNTIKLPFKGNCVVPATKFLTWTKLDPTELLIGSSDPSSGGWFRLVTACWDYQIRTIDGTYPNWRMVIPATKGKVSVALSDADVDLLKRAIPTFPGHDVHEPNLTFVADAGRVYVLGQGVEDKKPHRLDLTTTTSTGKGHITLGRQYLTDMLATGFTRFAFEDELTALRAEDGHGGVHALMPMRGGISPFGEKAKAETQVAPTPAPIAPAPAQAEPKKEEPVSKTTDTPANQPQPSALDRVLAAYDVAKLKVREANDALGTLATAVKDALREDKQRRAEIDNVRAGLARLQSIKV